MEEDGDGRWVGKTVCLPEGADAGECLADILTDDSLPVEMRVTVDSLRKNIRKEQ